MVARQACRHDAIRELVDNDVLSGNCSGLFDQTTSLSHFLTMQLEMKRAESLSALPSCTVADSVIKLFFRDSMSADLEADTRQR